MQPKNDQLIYRFFPFLLWWPMVTRETLKSDFVAGITGAIIVLPQGIAFATIAGLPPEYGLYTAMVTPVVAALFGSSRHLISGPTTAISIVIFSAISHHAEPGSAKFIQLALTLTFLAGVYQFSFGLARLGSLVNFVSHTVVIGFTAGAAILIATSQMKHILGLVVTPGGSFAKTWYEIVVQLHHLNPHTVLIATTTIVVAIIVRQKAKKLPGLLIALIAASALAFMLGGEDKGIALVGAIPSQLPPFSMPDFSLETIRQLAPEAFAVALLGLIEAVSISRSVAAKSQQRIDGNQEFIGQGLSNMVGSFFSSYAGSGSFTRSGINYDAGAQTPMSAIFAALFLMLIVLLIAPLTAYIPVAAMGGIILIVAWNLIEFSKIKHLIHASESETGILIVTFFATLFLELEFAIYIGVLLSLIIFLNRTSTPDIASLAPDREHPKGKLLRVDHKQLLQCPQLRIIRIDMSIYFGSINHIQNKIEELSENRGIIHILILMPSVNFVDTAGAEMLAQEARKLQSLGGALYFCAMKERVKNFLQHAGYIEEIGAHYFYDSKPEAIRSIYKLLEKDKCQRCHLRIFYECQHDSTLGDIPLTPL